MESAACFTTKRPFTVQLQVEYDMLLLQRGNDVILPSSLYSPCEFTHILHFTTLTLDFFFYYVYY